MTIIGAIAVPATGASAPVVRRRTETMFNTVAVSVMLTRRSLETLLSLAINRHAAMQDYGDADLHEATAVCEAIRALQDARRTGP